MAARLGLPGHDQLKHFVIHTVRDDGLLWTVLVQRVDRLVGGETAHFVIDDMSLLKKSTLSVGVARQYCGQLGKPKAALLLQPQLLPRQEPDRKDLLPHEAVQPSRDPIRETCGPLPCHAQARSHPPMAERL